MTRMCKVIAVIDRDNHAHAESHSEVDIDGKIYPVDPVELDLAGEEAAEFKKMFGAAQQAEIKQLKADAEKMTAEHAAAMATTTDQLADVIQQLADANANIDSLQTQVDTIADLQETINTQQQQISTTATELAAMAAERDEWKAQVPPPPKPREVMPGKLLARLMAVAPRAITKIWISREDIAAISAATLFTWPGLIDLDSPRLKEMFSGLVAAGLLTDDEMAKVLE